MHTIKFNLRYDVKNENKSLRLRYRFSNKEQIVRRSPLKIKSKDFNYKKQELKVESEYYKWFNKIKAEIPEQIKLLTDGEITPETALDNLLNVKKGSSADLMLKLEYISKTKNKPTTVVNRLNNIEWVEKNTKYKNLTQVHLKDTNVVSEIADAVYGSPSHKKLGGAINKLKKLDDMCNIAFGFRPFAKNDLIKKTNENPEPKYCEQFIFKQGIPNIKTGQDLESLLAWILSYCLSMDAQDLSVISKDYINHFAPYDKKDSITEFANENYIKNQNNFHLEGAYVFDRHLKMRRGKIEKNTSTVKFNIYPIPRIFELLKLCIKKYRPKHAYIGNDPFRLYNFTTENFEGKKTWRLINGTYTDKLKKLVSTVMSSSRGTFATNIHELGVPPEISKAFLKHSFRTSTFEKFYLKHPQAKFNIIQEAGIDEFGIINIWFTILGEAKEKKLIPKEFKISELDKKMFNKGKLLEKSWADTWKEYKGIEKAFQSLKSKEQDEKTKVSLGF